VSVFRRLRPSPAEVAYPVGRSRLPCHCRKVRLVNDKLVDPHASRTDTTIDWIDRQDLLYSDMFKSGTNKIQRRELSNNLSHISDHEIGDNVSFAYPCRWKLFRNLFQVSSPSQGSRSRKRRKITRTRTPEIRKRNVQYAFAGTALPRWTRRDIKKGLPTRPVRIKTDDRSILTQSGHKAQSKGASVANNFPVPARDNKEQRRRNVDRKQSRYARMGILRYISLRKLFMAHEKQRKRMHLANSRRKKGSVSPHPNISQNTFPNNQPQQAIEAPQMKRPLENPAWTLFLDCVDSDDPVKEWLRRLQIPCSVSVAFDNRIDERSNTTSGIVTGASTSILSNSKKGKSKRKPKVLVKTMDGNKPPPPRLVAA
jgi:hypothetical protein